MNVTPPLSLYKNLLNVQNYQSAEVPENYRMQASIGLDLMKQAISSFDLLRPKRL